MASSRKWAERAAQVIVKEVGVKKAFAIVKQLQCIESSSKSVRDTLLMIETYMDG